MAASESFAKLAEQAEEAERNVKAAATQNKAELKARVDAARKSADDHAAELRAKTQDAGDQAERHWHEVQTSWDAHIQRIRRRMDERKAEHDASVAEHDAKWAEDDALDAIDFAASAIKEAEYSVLNAAMLRVDADAMAASS
jgi:hypothetical protein